MLHRLKQIFRNSEQASASFQAVPDADGPEALKNQGNTHLAKGELDAARQCYEKAIDLNPNYAEAFNNLGYCCMLQGNDREGEGHLHRAIALRPDLANAHGNLGLFHRRKGSAERALASYETALRLAPGNASMLRSQGELLLELGRNDDARAALEKAIAADPVQAASHHALGIAWQRLGCLEKAKASWERALALNPEFPLVHYNLALLLYLQGNIRDAARALQKAVELAPDFVDARQKLGNLLIEQSRFDAAMVHFEEVIKRAPENVHAHNALGLIFTKQDKPSRAAACFQDAIRLAPDFAVAYMNLAEVLHSSGRLDEALAACEAAIGLAPEAARPYVMKALVLKDQDRFEEALPCLDRAVALDPERDDARFIMALVRLACGDLAGGWPLYGFRFHRGGATVRRDFGMPTWNGESLEDKAIAVWGDQGIGDEILFASMFPDLVAQSRRCVIECAPKLLPLFAQSFPDATVVPRQSPAHPAVREGIDLQTGAADAARWLRGELRSFPSRDRYLAPDPARLAYWKARLAELGKGLRVGFCWRSNHLDSYRNLHYADLEHWGPVFAVEDVHFISLQCHPRAEELDAARHRFSVPLHVYDEVDLFDDLAETAALTGALDVVIGAPTAACLLAAALGVPTWMMTYGTPWQTFGTDAIPWLPTMRCFTRSWNKPWEEVLTGIAGQLEARRDSTRAIGER